MGRGRILNHKWPRAKAIMGKFTCNIWVTKVGEDTPPLMNLDVHSKVSLLQSEKQPVLVKVAVSVCLI